MDNVNKFDVEKVPASPGTGHYQGLLLTTRGRASTGTSFLGLVFAGGGLGAEFEFELEFDPELTLAFVLAFALAEFEFVFLGDT